MAKNSSKLQSWELARELSEARFDKDHGLFYLKSKERLGFLQFPGD